MSYEIKAFPLLECKTEEGGRFSGYAATYSRDSYGDRIIPGAFGQTIKDRRGHIPIFMNHNPDSPLGFSEELAEDGKGLWISGILSIDTRGGADAYALLKTAKTVDYKMGLSIGFIAEEVEYASDGRLLKSIDLWETSLTPFPANSGARVEQFKSLRNVEQILRDVGGCSKESAKRTLSALRPHLSAGADGQPPTQKRDVTGLGRMAAVMTLRAQLETEKP
jgi:HK97 family phage prohead protease